VTIDPKNLSSTAVLTFKDEFDTLSLRSAGSGTWTTNYWWGAANGSTLTNNGEQEWYINHLYAPTASVKPWTVNNGVLTLTGAPADASIQPHINNYKYTSGMITSYESFTQQYGYFEMRAQLPAGQGLWPAFWLLPANGQWPPEIDIMEVIGSDPFTLHTYTHTNETGTKTHRGEPNPVGVNTSTGYHTYAVNWQSDYITWYFDGTEVYKTNTPADAHQPMYILANLAIGGYWPGSPNASTVFPAEMKVDYIRAYADAPPPSVVQPPPSVVQPPPSVVEPPPSVVQPPPQSVVDPPTSTKLFTLPATGATGSSIRGTARSDTLDGTSAGNRIDGRGGADTMSGNGGNDTYVVDRTTDLVIEGQNAGIDTVLSKSSYTLPDHVENLTLSGTRALTATGNALANILNSNNAGSTLNGGDGNDILIAGRGANALTGGAGSDIFEFNTVASRGGKITDFTPGTDVLDLRGLFSRINYQGSTPETDGYVSFASDGAGGTVVRFDTDGAGLMAPKVVTTLLGVSPDSLTMQSDWFFH
jgi:beta-glucanase (GH16 family)